MEAARYNKIRRIIFSCVHDPAKGFSWAFNCLETYKSTLGWKGYKGLKAELFFYQKHKKEFALTVAGDMGEHADFSGIFGTEQTRFDVTTTLKFKQYRDYEPFLDEGLSYKIALLDENIFKIIDVFDLAFPKCNHCNGYLIPSLVLCGMGFDEENELKMSTDQYLVHICTGCSDYTINSKFTHIGLPIPDQHFEALDISDIDKGESLLAYQNSIVDTYKYFRREYCENLMVIGEHIFMQTEEYGEPHWVFNLCFKNEAVFTKLPHTIDCKNNI